MIKNQSSRYHLHQPRYDSKLFHFSPPTRANVQRRSNERRSVVEAKKQRRAKRGGEMLRGFPGRATNAGLESDSPAPRIHVTRVSPWFMVISRETFPAIVPPPSILALVTPPLVVFWPWIQANLVSIHRGWLVGKVASIRGFCEIGPKYPSSISQVGRNARIKGIIVQFYVFEGLRLLIAPLNRTT